jgi:hypothetical protein
MLWQESLNIKIIRWTVSGGPTFLGEVKQGGLADMLNLMLLPIRLPQIRLKHPPKHLQKNLEASLGDRRIIPPFAQLIADESVLRPRKLVEAEDDACVAKLFADEIAAGVGDVGVFDAEDHGHFAFEGGEEVEGVDAIGRSGGGGVGCRVRAEGAAVDIGCEVGDAGCDSGVEL